MEQGLYIHVPFCKKRCIYCDFYSTTYGKEWQEKYVQSLCREMKIRKDWLTENSLTSIYIGGGTPSQLPLDMLGMIFEEIKRDFIISQEAEITIEVNPDDVTADYVNGLSQLPVNRVSMGVQSFDNEILSFLNRRHDADTAIKAITLLYNKGIKNLSIDLIYGLPGQTLASWKNDIIRTLQLPIKHLSAYSLTYELDTKLWELRRNGKVKETDEDMSLEMYETLIDVMEKKGWNHYEISNFSLPEFCSHHNSGYWREMHYLGLGPSAHSYNGNIRWANIPDLNAYVRLGGNVLDAVMHEEEQLDSVSLFNERVMKCLRTRNGLSLTDIETDFGKKWKDELMHMAHAYIDNGKLTFCNDTLCLTRQGIFISDSIMSSLMRDEE